MMRFFAVMGIASLAGCSLTIPDFRPGTSVVPAAAVVPPPIAAPNSAKERFITAASENGCVVNQTTSGDILTAATLSREDLARIMTELRADGQGEIASDGASFRVKTGACA